MKLEKKTFGGFLGFELRKIMPKICSKAFFSLKMQIADKNGRIFIQKKLQENLVYPTIVSVETINKCNGNCAFCCCNKESDKRNFKIMSDELFEKIILDLKANDFSGVLMLVMNNEPFMDKKIVERLEFARKNVPNAIMKLISNGSITTIEQINDIIDKKLLDEFVINNYSTKMKLNDNVQKIYHELKDKDLNFKLKIDMRYCGEILSNRANSSPNNQGKKKVKYVCTLPYTDFNINPYGISTLCCCDATEKTNLGNMNVQTISEIFNGEKYKNIRELMKDGRDGYGFCQYCDFIDNGMRQNRVKRFIEESSKK